MSRLFLFGILSAAVVGGWCFFRRYEIRGLENLGVKPRGATPASPAPPPIDVPDPQLPSVPVGLKAIRVATFNCGPLDRNKIGRSAVVRHLAEVIRRFDLVALQDIQARNSSILVQLLQHVGADGRSYSYAAPPDVDRDKVHTFSAFVFDRATIQFDPSTVKTVQDPGGYFARPPLVASFRARGPDPSRAFTFTLVNVHLDAERAAEELELLGEVFRAVRADGRNEDDVILLGDLEADDRHLGPLGQMPNITPLIFSTPTTSRGTQMADNILIDFRATKEFTGRCGVSDLMRELNLSAQEVSDMTAHLPVWAEFSVVEGGYGGETSQGAGKDSP